MSIFRLSSYLSLLTVLWFGFQVQATAVEYSADTYQKGPQGGEAHGKIYVTKGKMRMEMSQNGQTMVQIMDTEKQVSWMIFPAQRSYMEQRGQSPAATPQQGGEVNPCAGIPTASCKRLGEEKISGRNSTKWEISFSQQGKTMRGWQWIDAERGSVLKEVLPNGQQSELKLLGIESLSGRKVEKWEMLVTQANKAPQRFYRWYDPELETEIRQEYPGGFVREIRNILVGKQDPQLFVLPAGYKKMSMPQGAPGARQ